MMIIGKEKPSAEKEEIIRSLIRTAPNDETIYDVVEALSAYPTEALKRVKDYGTRVEVYEPDENGDGEEFPNYMPTLSHPLINGAYNTKANVLGVEGDNVSPFLLLHEFAHALDASLGNLSDNPQWKGAHNLACNTNQVVRDYAKQDPSEYFAENTSAYLVSDDALFPMIEEGLERGLVLNGQDERKYMQTYQNFCHGRVERVDSQAFQMVDDLFKNLEQLPAAAASPALSEAEYQAVLDSRPAE